MPLAALSDTRGRAQRVAGTAARRIQTCCIPNRDSDPISLITASQDDVPGSHAISQSVSPVRVILSLKCSSDALWRPLQRFDWMQCCFTSSQMIL